MYKRVLGIVLTIALIISVAACSSSAPTTEEPKDTTNQEPKDTTKQEPIKVRVGLPEIVNAKFAQGEDYSNNLWTKLFKEKINVDVVVDWITTEYDTKLNLAIASGELPDMFTVNIVQLNQLIEADMLEDLTSSYEKYASPSLIKMIEPNRDIVETAMRDGKLLAIPRLHYGDETSTSFLWARKDWLEGNGIKEVKTIEDFEKMMEAFKTNNGAKFGTMLDKTLSAFFEMASSFHAYPKIWVDGPDGKIVHGATLPETKNALAKWAEWYKKGYIKKDFATMDSAAMLRDAYNGEVGTYAQQNWAGWQVGADMVKNKGEGTYFVSMNLPSVDDNKILYPRQFSNSVYSVVRKGYKHPEVLVELINTYIDVLNDSIGNGTMTLEEVLPFNTNDMHHITGPFKVEFAHYQDIKDVSSSVITGNKLLGSGNAVLFYNEILKWKNEGDLVGLGRYLQMGHETASLVLGNSHVDNEQINKTKVWGAMPQAMLDYGTTLDDLLTEGYTKIIMGLEDISYYDTLIEAWRHAGGDEVTAAVNKMYGK
ncbi:extracellular solute-binding protein [Paenibacillus spongiae]|uniref:Extracellular solute-binding protein n=1 Tax=Paenibacillus spongiae TaxID=2909671 RepID=A0ABY5SAI3_9BACL|nr:extracellular solute-binding protein [Paenibacillus spongiae]UVI30941.1 extracellular solute-binding protein [Paenibacillus spongiae]